MINTIEIKQQQLTNGFFSIGTGDDIVLIMGSCRAVPYLNFLAFWNSQNGNRFTIHFIDPFNWNWDINDARTDYEKVLEELESSSKLSDMLNSVDIFIHEYYSNAGMFNVNKSSEKNIYRFGMKPMIDICLPNFNDIFILTRDIVSFDMDIKKKAIQDYNVIGKLSSSTIFDIDEVREKNLNKFYDICSKTDFPEFAEIFKSNFKLKRMFWTFNHVANGFTIPIFKLLASKIGVFIDGDFEGNISSHDMYANNYTYLCEYDLGYEWNEQIKPLRDII